MTMNRLISIVILPMAIRSQSPTIRWNSGWMKSRTSCKKAVMRMRRQEMTIQTIDQKHFNQKTRQVRAQVANVLTKWGLLPRFKRWRLTQDPDTGMVVLFGILNNNYIATHTAIPFSDYFDPRLLHDLANELQVQVVSCNSDGLRYAFILDRGQLDDLPTHIDFPFIDNGKLSARVVYKDKPQPPVPVPPVGVEIVEDQT